MRELYRVLSYLQTMLTLCKPEDRPVYRKAYFRVQDIMLAERRLA
jgi:hypothetical protein